MAKCTPINKPEFQLELTNDEAHALYSVLNNVGGAPCGPRGEIDKIRQALSFAGVVREHILSGTVRFES